MRQLQLGLLALIGLAGVAAAETPAPTPLADTPHFNACRDEARTKANAYVQDYLVPATAEDTAPPGAYMAIVYGHKFVAPLHAPTNGDIEVHGLGEVMSKRTQIYHEELSRCLGHLRVNVKFRLNQAIFIE